MRRNTKGRLCCITEVGSVLTDEDGLGYGLGGQSLGPGARWKEISIIQVLGQEVRK